MILIIVLLVIILIILLRYECLTIDDEPLNNLVTQINNKSLTIDNLNTSNITNKELINSQNITSTEGSIDNLTVNNQLTTKSNLNGYNIYSSYITNYGTIKSSDLISHHNVTYLFDTNATIYLGKIQNQTIRTNAVHKCCAFGYYDISSGSTRTRRIMWSSSKNSSSTPLQFYCKEKYTNTTDPRYPYDHEGYWSGDSIGTGAGTSYYGLQIRPLIPYGN